MTATDAVASALRATSDVASVRERLAAYARLLLERNARLNLTAARDAESVAAHVSDSLGLAARVREPLVDVGSGGGFPVIPLAIVTGYRCVAIESVAKKATFLREVVAALDLPVRVVNARAEDAARDPDLRGHFAAATARAVGNASTVLELTVPFLTIGGVAVLQRGRFDGAERLAASDAALVLGAKIVEETAAGSEDDLRRVVIVRKLFATGPRFPRRAGIPAKRPLCYDGSGTDE